MIGGGNFVYGVLLHCLGGGWWIGQMGRKEVGCEAERESNPYAKYAANYDFMCCLLIVLFVVLLLFPFSLVSLTLEKISGFKT